MGGGGGGGGGGGFTQEPRRGEEGDCCTQAHQPDDDDGDAQQDVASLHAALERVVQVDDAAEADEEGGHRIPPLGNVPDGIRAGE